MVSCDFLDKEPTKLTPENYFNTPAEANSFLTGIYAILSQPTFYGGDYMYLVAGDDLSHYGGSGRGPASTGLICNNATTSDNAVTAFWYALYSGINRANMFLENIDKVNGFDAGVKEQYIAEARFAVRGAENSGAAGGLAALLLPSGASVGADAHIVAEYIQSPDIMEAIDGELHIFRHFSSREYDLISRLAADATRDERLSYWNWAVKPSFDPETGIIALSVKAYDPATAKKLAEAVLTKSEALVNAMSRRAQDDAIALAMSEVKTAEQRVSAAQDAMRAFRDRSGMLDPASTAGGLQSIVSQLESEAVKVRAEIAEASTYMSKDAPALVGLRARLAAVEKQLVSEKLRLAGEARPDSLTSVAGEYEDLQTESEFARQQLVSAMTSLETARVKAEAKSRYVVAFQIPVLPDESLYPRPFLFTAYVFVGALALVGLCSLIIAAVREHAGF